MKRPLKTLSILQIVGIIGFLLITRRVGIVTFADLPASPHTYSEPQSLNLTQFGVVCQTQK